MEFICHPLVVGVISSGITYAYFNRTQPSIIRNDAENIFLLPKVKYSILIGLMMFIIFTMWNETKQKMVSNNVSHGDTIVPKNHAKMLINKPIGVIRVPTIYDKLMPSVFPRNMTDINM